MIPNKIKRIALKIFLILLLSNAFAFALWRDYSHFAIRFGWPPLDFTEAIEIIGALFIPSLISNFTRIIFNRH
jgi:hypothetical protein